VEAPCAETDAQRLDLERGMHSCHRARALRKGDCLMLDAVLLVIGCGFFVAAILYTVACDRI
jgi:hypothetical protein